MKKVELLAPAGNMEALKAAVNAGCDAVYLGLKSFSARAFAGNFSHEEFIEAIHYCHTRNVKIYCTINTMLYETEIENAKKEVDFLYENDCDAILIQDLGLFHYVRTCYPDMPVHCSTQMHIHNLKGVEFMKNQGVERVVLARETPIEIIQQACQMGVEIEVFTYGAICISYSGQCMMSASVKNRSANRGMCAQCCRLKYTRVDGSHFKEGDYILSPKDLNVIDQLPSLLDAGVSSLKIEGRMKRSEYVYLVIKTFREAIDAYYANKTYHVSSERLKQLEEMFYRGFSNGHLFHDDVTHRMSQYRPNHQGIAIGKVLAYRNGRVQVKLSDDLYQNDGLRIINEPHDTGLSAIKIYKNDLLVNHAKANDIVWITCPSDPAPKKGQILRKTTDTHLLDWIHEQMEEHPRLIPLRMKYRALTGQPFEVIVEDENGHVAKAQSDSIIEKAKNAAVTQDKIVRSLSKTGEYPYEIVDIHGEAEDIFLPVSIMNETRRRALQLLDEARSTYRINAGKQPYHLELCENTDALSRIIYESSSVDFNNSDIHHMHHLDVIDEDNKEKKTYSDVLISSVCDLNNTLDHCIASPTMNLANSYALAYVLSQGASGIVFSSEMDNEQIKQALDAFTNRYGFVPKTYRLVYGKRTVMYIKDRFVNEDINAIRDLNDLVYEVKKENKITTIHEPELYVCKNPYCFGSYLIVEGKKGMDILEESYEEISRRI